jgi:hypothetical protein
MAVLGIKIVLGIIVFAAVMEGIWKLLEFCRKSRKKDIINSR